MSTTSDRAREVAPPFRDPSSLDAAARPHRLALARALVGAEELPVALPRFGLRLDDVRVDGAALCLELSAGAPVARVRLSPRRRELAPPSSEAPEIGIEVRPGGERHAAALEAIRARLARAITPARWEAARPHFDALRALPLDVPMAYFRQLVSGVGGREGLVRTGFACNQDCGMCWQSRAWSGPGAAQVLTWVEDLRRAGATRLILSGGEPTLDAALPEYVARARALGFAAVTLETNAVQLAKPEHAARLAAAGLTDAFVSLHAADAAISDAITRARGTHARTLAGVDALLDAGVTVTLNAVMTAEGLLRLDELPALVHARFGGREGLRGLMVSLPTDPFDGALRDRVLPDPAIVREVLPRTIERALSLGVPVLGLDGPCGPPLCAFGADPRVARLEPLGEALEFRVHPPACDRCAVRSACFGVRREQLARFGDACTAPLAARPR